MRRAFACILLIIYSCFAAGTAWQLLPEESSDPASFQISYGRDINPSIKEQSDSSSHLKVVNFHKLHKHLAASRTVKIPGVKFSCLSSPVYTSATFLDYRKLASNTPIPENFNAGIFIKNRVLRI